MGAELSCNIPRHDDPRPPDADEQTQGLCIVPKPRARNEPTEAELVEVIEEQPPVETPNYRLRQEAAELSPGIPVAIAPEWSLKPTVCCPYRVSDTQGGDLSISLAAGGSRSGCGPQRLGGATSSPGPVGYRGGGPYRGAYHEPNAVPVQVEAHNSHHYRDYRPVQYKRGGSSAGAGLGNGEPMQVKASLVESPSPNDDVPSINQFAHARSANVCGKSCSVVASLASQLPPLASRLPPPAASLPS